MQGPRCSSCGGNQYDLSTGGYPVCSYCGFTHYTEEAKKQFLKPKPPEPTNIPSSPVPPPDRGPMPDDGDDPVGGCGCSLIGGIAIFMAFLYFVNHVK